MCSVGILFVFLFSNRFLLSNPMATSLVVLYLSFSEKNNLLQVLVPVLVDSICFPLFPPSFTVHYHRQLHLVNFPRARHSRRRCTTTIIITTITSNRPRRRPCRLRPLRPRRSSCIVRCATSGSLCPTSLANSNIIRWLC